MGNMPIKYLYRELCRRYRRLPLDKLSVNKLQIITKKSFQIEASYLNKKKYYKHTQLLDDILIREDYSKIEKLLDIIYKQKPENIEWIQELNNTNYLSLKKEWPQVHLIKELVFNGQNIHIKEYNNNLEKEKNDEISLTKYFSIDESLSLGSLTTLPKPGLNKSHSTIINESKKLHEFLFNNQTRLTHLKILPFEALYPTNRFGTPLHITKRDKILKQKITYIKTLFEEFKPITKTDLENLVSFAIYNSKNGDNDELEISKNFFKYMKKKHDIEKTTLNPIITKYVRSKSLIPNDNNIRKYYRDYVRKQFYLEDNIYKMCWMQNFYENSNTNTYKLNTT